MHRGPAWPWGDGGCSPFKGAVFWGLSDLTQARGWDPSCVPSPPAPYLRRPHLGQPRQLQSGRADQPHILGSSLLPGSPPRQPPAEEHWPSGIPVWMWGRTLVLPAPPPTAHNAPAPGWLCSPAHTLPAPGKSISAPPPSPPQPSCPRASLPCPRQEVGGVCTAPALSLGNRPSSLRQGPLGRMCRSPNTLGSLDTTRQSTILQRWWSAQAISPQGSPAHAGTNSQPSSCPPAQPQPLSLPTAQQLCVWGLLPKQQVMATAASSWFGLLWKAALPGGP